jgi:dUTPase
MTTRLRWGRHPDFPEAKAPLRAHPTDAGVDVFAAEAVTVRPGDVLKCRTGLCVHAEPSRDAPGENPGYNQPGGWTLGCFLWDKSGLAARGLTTLGLSDRGASFLGGVIDDPYTGEILVVVANVFTAPLLKVLADLGDRTIEALTAADVTLHEKLVGAAMVKKDALERLFNVEVREGEKLCQLVVQRVELPLVDGDPSGLAETARGARGFASTGA